MTAIGGSGGSGPVGPNQGPGGVEVADEADAAGGPGGADEVAAPAEAGDPGAADPLARLAAELDAGRITPEQAMAELIDESVAGMPAADQAEVRRLMEDLVASDPYLNGLLGGG